MPLLLAYLWIACLLASAIRTWHLKQVGPSGPLRITAAALPLFLALRMALGEGHRIWFHVPRILLHPAIAWTCTSLWALMVLRNLTLLARMAAADHRLRTHAPRLTALETAPWLGYAQLVRQVGGHRPPPIRGRDDLSAPVAVGLFPTTLLVPLDWVPEGWQGRPEPGTPFPEPSQQLRLRLALAHELVHIGQGDLWRRALDLSAALFLPLEVLPLPLRRDPRWGAGLRRLMGQASLQAFHLEEARADLWASEAVRGREHPPATRAGFLRSALPAGALGALVWMAPGQLNLAYAFGSEVAIPHLLPEGWTLLPQPTGPGSHGFIPASSRREACVRLDLPSGPCALAQTIHLAPAALEGILRLEFEAELEYEGAALPPACHAGFLLHLQSQGDSYTLHSWPSPGEAGGDLETLGPGRFRVRNGLDLEGWSTARTEALSLQVHVAGPGCYRIYAPRLWMVLPDGTRRAYDGAAPDLQAGAPAPPAAGRSVEPGRPLP